MLPRRTAHRCGEMVNTVVVGRSRRWDTRELNGLHHVRNSMNVVVFRSRIEAMACYGRAREHVSGKQPRDR